jgi:hypothetical protein
MNHRATPRFWSCYRRLPEEVQRLADRSNELLRNDPLKSSSVSGARQRKSVLISDRIFTKYTSANAAAAAMVPTKPNADAIVKRSQILPREDRKPHTAIPTAQTEVIARSVFDAPAHLGVIGANLPLLTRYSQVIFR